MKILMSKCMYETKRGENAMFMANLVGVLQGGFVEVVKNRYAKLPSGPVTLSFWEAMHLKDIEEER